MSATALPDPPIVRLRWSRSVRLVAASYPPVRAFEDTVLPADLEVVLEVLAVTDPPARAAAGDLSLVPPAERLSGPGTSPIMAAFTHPNPAGSRFADARYGAYYAARHIETAIAETRYHQRRFLDATALPSTTIVLNAYEARIDAPVHDVRDAHERFGVAYVTEPRHYPRSQAFARRLRDAGSGGIAYDSVRDPGGQCVALFRPRGVRPPARHRARVSCRWDGEARDIVEVAVESL